MPSTRQPGEVSIHIHHPICYGTYSSSDAEINQRMLPFDKEGLSLFYGGIAGLWAGPSTTPMFETNYALVQMRIEHILVSIWNISTT